MKHNFTPKNLTPALCATCNRPIKDHSKVAVCEACENIGPCNIDKVLTNNMLLCENCEAKELALNARTNHNAVNELRLADTEIKNYTGFFNAKITPIVTVKEIFDLNGKTFAEYHEVIKNQIEHFARTLFDSSIVTTEDTISKLLIEFRAEVRTKLKEGDINYTPPIKAPKVLVPAKKKTPLEKMAEMVVAAEGKKGNVITLLDAKRKLKEEMGLSE